MTWMVATGRKNGDPIKITVPRLTFVLKFSVVVVLTSLERTLSSRIHIAVFRLSLSHVPIRRTWNIRSEHRSKTDWHSEPPKADKITYGDYLLLKRSWKPFAICMCVYRTNANHNASGPHSCPQFIELLLLCHNFTQNAKLLKIRTDAQKYNLARKAFTRQKLSRLSFPHYFINSSETYIMSAGINHPFQIITTL